MTTRIKAICLILLIGSLISCTTAQTDPTEPANEIAEVAPTEPPATETPLPTNTPEPTSTNTPEPTNTPVPTDTPEPTNTPEPTQTPTPTPLPPSDLVSADNCYLPVANFTGVGIGVPRYEGLLQSVGTVNAAVLFVDFEDVPATNRTPEEVFNIVSPTSSDYFSQVSYGRMDLNLQPHLTWLRLSQPSAHYGLATNSFFGHRAFLQEAIDLADAEVDFSTADTVIVMTNPDAEALIKGPASQFPIPGQGLFADGVEISSGVTSGHDLLNWGGLWLNHELGHNMTLSDLYAFDGDAGGGWHRFVGPYSLMGLISGSAPELFAIERWQLGWIDDEQITCQTAGEATVALSAIEQPDGIKAHIVPLSRTSMLVVESRLRTGYDSTMVQRGALVYLVDAGNSTGAGPIRVLTHVPSDLMRDSVPLRPGESLTHENVTITVLDENDDGDIIQVTVE